MGKVYIFFVESVAYFLFNYMLKVMHFIYDEELMTFACNLVMYVLTNNI